MWERAPTFCEGQPYSSRALHSAARGGRTAAPAPRSVVFGGRVVRDHAEVSARAAVGAQPPHNQHLYQRAKRAPAKQQQCCAPQSRSVPARGGAAFPPTCGPLPAPRASADSARERSSPTYCPLRWWWICGWQHHALPRRRRGLERARSLFWAAKRHGALHMVHGDRLDATDGRDDA